MPVVRVLLFLVLVAKLCQSNQGIVKELDGGYINITVAIHRDIPYNPQLVQKIKELFTQASPALHKATFGGAYFKEVTVVVPKTWSYHPSYENVSADLFPYAHFKVDVPSSKHGNEPYTLQDKGCGEPGLYTHWTPNYLLGNVVSKSPARYNERKEMRLIQEWSHLRYGLFDEFGYPGNLQYPSFHYENGKLSATMCGDNIWGNVDLACSVSYNEGEISGDPTNCTFVPYEDQTELSGASIMFTVSVPGIEYFCDDTPKRKHNSKSPNKQNQLCNGRSAWQVISQHSDFNNPDTKSLMARYAQQSWTAGVPKFRVLRISSEADMKIVFVLDTSGSMQGRPMELLHAATSRAILDHVPDGSRVGIVSFCTSARLLAPLTLITQASRAQLVAKLPKTDTSGSTAIGLGLLKGLEVLGAEARGAQIFLVTDGEENVKPFINDTVNELAKSAVQVISVAFGNKATDKLERLAQDTGGKVFLFPDLQGTRLTTALDSAFLESTTILVSEEQQPIRTVNEEVHLSSNWIERAVTVEEGLGKNLVVTVTAPNIGPVDLTLTDPNGQKISSGNSYFVKDEGSVQRIRIHVPMAAKGDWKLSLKTSSSPSDVDLSIQSEPEEGQQSQRKTIRIRAWMDNIQPTYPASVRIFAQVVKGALDLVQNATVTAVVTRPGSKSVDVKLIDNGAGADVTSNDGIYSGYFSQFTGNGRYAVFVRMIAYDESNNLSGSTRTRIIRSTVQQVRIERVTEAGSFRLDNWQPIDMIPPSTVTDLTAYLRNGHIDRFWITWTSPGDDMDKGNVTEMDIRVSFDPDTLRQNFTSCVQALNWLAHNWTLPEGGEMQTLELIVPDGYHDTALNNKTYYIALRGSDEVGNIGAVSNVASVTFISEMPSRQEFHGEQNRTFLFIVSGACGLFVLVVIVLVITICCRRANREIKYSIESEMY